MIPPRRGAHAETGRAPSLGLALGQREDAVRAADGGLRRLPGERRLERRPPARRGRGDGRARQHARHLHLRGQRREPGGHDHRLLQRADDAERDRPHRRAAALADRDYGGLDAWGTDAYAPHYASAWAWAGNAPFQWGKQCRLPPRRHAQRHGDLLAGADQGRRRVARPVHSLHRHRADDPRSGRYPRAQGRGRDRPEADGGDELPLQLRGRARTGAAHRAVLRDRRKPGDLQGRLVGRLQARPDPLGHLAADDGEVRTRSLRPGAGHLGAVLPPRRLQPGERPCRGEPGEARRAQEALLGRGREAQRVAAAGGVLGLLRDPAADADDHDPAVLRRRREHRLRDDPARLRPLLRDRG